MGHKRSMIMTLVLLLAGFGVESGDVFADAGHGKEEKVAKKQAEGEEEGHHHPENWLFRMPPGNPAKGRTVFLRFDCNSCHEVKGENFKKPEGVSVGPELSQMGPMHPLGYFTESTMNPNAEISPEKYRAADGNSKMPSFNEDMTVQELIDISAYMASLRPPGMADSVTGEGKVIAVVPASKQVVVEHGDIKGFMEAMTMGYKVDPATLLDGLKAGDQVRFTIDTNKKAIVKIEKMKM